MANNLRLSHRIEADLRNYHSRCVALEADGECFVCWKEPDSEAQVLGRPDVPINARLEYVEWEHLDPLTDAPGDTVSLVCSTEDLIYYGLAKLHKKELLEGLGHQSALKIVILGERLNVVGEKQVEWDEEKRAEARRLLDRLLKHLEGDPVRYHYFIRTDSTLQAKY